ncbi:MAG TPA: hypothetical protein VK427_08670, partial [Kofleriaceae bacterium]|nr:hypothetical protein [Kofleriaceae bacterium]
MTLFSRTFHVAALVTGLGLVPTLVAAKPASPTAKAQRATIAAAYGQLPLAFEANHGQHPQPVDFLARGPNYTLWLTPTEAVFSLRNATTDTPTTVRMQLVDSNPSAVARGERKLPGIVNHAIGSDATKWRTASTFAEVRYDDVYPGIDVVYYGKQRQLEYDFVVAPGSSPDRIALAFTGVDRMRIEADGSLVLTQPGGDLRWAPPVLYQRIGGTRRPVTGAYRIVEGKVGFAVGKYDRSRPLVIDPVLYSTFIGGSLNDRADAIVIDSEN